MQDSMRPPGMRDMLPDDMERFRLIESAFRTACLGWGYREVRTPTIERLHLFTAAGTLSPQMLDRVYSFLDWDGWSGERVVLRPDSTIPVARLYVEKLKRPAAKTRQALLRPERPPLLRGRRLPRGLAVRRGAHRRHLPPRRHRAHPDRLRSPPEPGPDARNQALRPRHPARCLLRRRLRPRRAARRLRPRARWRCERALRGPRTPARTRAARRRNSLRWRAKARLS